MKVRAPALLCAAAALFVACGRLDLGDYADLPRDDSEDPSITPPSPPNGAGGAAGESPASPDSGAAGSASGEASTRDPAGGAGGETAGGGAGGETAAGAAGAPASSAGGESGVGGEGTWSPAEKTSCRYLPDICGSQGTYGPSQRSCCAVAYLPPGEVVRGGIEGGEPPLAPSYVSAFYLGIYEVTVGRFQAFLDDYDTWRASGAPRPGDGHHPRVPSSGWRPDWLRYLDSPPGSHGLGADRAAVEAEVSGCMGIPFSTAMWLQPANCVSFYEAQAFCIWDGGRLPTDLEWEYAAAGGAENRPYPWGWEEPTHEHAMYGCFADVGSPCIIPPVGSFKRGVSRSGLFDLAGSLGEWTFDTVGPAFPTPCQDCANVDQLYEANPRNTRGGDWASPASSLTVAANHFIEPQLHLPMHGFRCAYDVP